MANKLRTYTKRLLVFINLGVAFVFLLACLNPYINPTNWWFVSLLGIGFPFLLLAVVGFLIWWLFIKKKYALISGVALLLGLKNITAFYSFHFPRGFKAEKKNCKPSGWQHGTWHGSGKCERIIIRGARPV